MRDDDDPLRELWQSDNTVPEVDMDTIRDAQARLERQARALRTRETLAAVLVTPPALYFLFRALGRDALVEVVAWGLLLLAAAFVITVLARRAVPPSADPEGALLDFIEDHRAALHHHADLLAWAPLWYFVPFVPGFALMAVATWPGTGSPPAFYWLYWGLAVPGVFVLGIALNLVAARRLRKRAEDLPRGVTPRP
ncbi:MAG: hypothetical protein AAF211_26305 [Myxococcota bacterium]